MNIISKISVYTLLLALLYSCAHPVNPGGGPKDEVPPQVLLSTPENGSANFTGDRFSIEFDEFVKLEDIQNEAMISPPLLKKPDYKVKGKSIQVKFNEELKSNTTYSIYFGDAIRDITEGNPVSNYTYIFSTGPFVDSLSMQGQVVDAFTLLPIDACFVMLYKDDNDTIPLDSLPLRVRPYYLSKTNEEGNFRFSGLGDDEYLLFAIQDMNSSLSFDQPNEQIAFIDSLVRPNYIEVIVPDTNLIDSLANQLIDSTLLSVADTILKEELPFLNEQLETFKLYMYREEDTLLKLMSSKIIRDNTVEFIFNLPAEDVSLTPVNIVDREQWYIIEESKERDTIRWYFKNLEKDTLQVLVKHRTDTLEFLNLRLNKVNARQPRREKKEGQSLKYFTIPDDKTLKPGSSPQLGFYQPIVSINFDSVVLIANTDTILKPEYSFSDSLNMRIKIPVENVEDAEYAMVIPDSCIYDWNGLANKEMVVKFQTLPLSDYSKLSLKITVEQRKSLIVQLIDTEDQLIKQDIFSDDTTLLYNYVKAGNYLLKAIIDKNNNGKWDTGKYSEKKQAEKVFFYPIELELRANWELEEEWTID